MSVRPVLAALAAVLLLALGGCGETFTYEAEPARGDDNGGKNPEAVECFTIEADSSSGDDGDEQLGLFCKVD